MNKAFSKIYIRMAKVSLFNIVRAQIRVHITESFYSENYNKQITACYSFKPFETDIAH
jgi:hypothetical protein